MANTLEFLSEKFYKYEVKLKGIEECLALTFSKIRESDVQKPEIYIEEGPSSSSEDRNIKEELSRVIEESRRSNVRLE